MGDWLEVEAITESMAIASATSRSLGAFEEFAVASVPGHWSELYA